VPAAEPPISPAEATALFAELAHWPALVLAVSGGPDSTALLVLAARWRAQMRRGPRLLAVTVDHRLRPESAKEARAVQRLAEKLGIAHRIVRWWGSKPAAGLQAEARAARYALLAAAARKAGARHIVTAHTLDDQAETIFFRLARGSGLTGLAGMARVSLLPCCRVGGGQGPRGKVHRARRTGGEIELVRPFLAISKARLIATLEAAKIPFAEDPSNTDPRFTRARLRKVMPLLAAEGLDAGRFSLLARRVARAEATIEAAVAAALPRVLLTQWSNSGPIMLDGSRFQELPAEVALRLLGRAIGRVGHEGHVELGKLEALFDALRGRGRNQTDGGRFRRTLGGAVVTLAGGRLAVEKAPARRPQRPQRP
jgi:tRNA(Ile)-lysidine synthase